MRFLRDQCSVIDLIPHSHQMRIKAVSDAISLLGTLETSLLIANQAISRLITKDFQCFDPLIGENSCQIRAYMLYFLWKNKGAITKHTSLQSLSSKIDALVYQIRQLVQLIKTEKRDRVHHKFPCRVGVTLSVFLDANEIQIFFSKEILMFIMNYFLSKYTITDEQGIHSGINYLSMCQELGFSKTLARRVVHLFQTRLAHISCQFVKSLAKEISLVNPDHYLIIDLLTMIDDDGRMTIPCFLSMDIIMKHMRLKTTKAIVNIYKSASQHTQDNFLGNFHLSLSKNTTNIEPSPYLLLEKDVPVVVLRGVSKNDFVKYPKLTLKNICMAILASTARHPQYPGKQLANYKENPFAIMLQLNLDETIRLALVKIQKEFLSTKQWAIENGCDIDSPELFFVTHIFCDSFSHYQKMLYDESSIIENISALI